MHNGMRPFGSASDACARFREQGGVVVLLSNSPRPHAAVTHQLAQIGVPETSFDAVVTSGDVTQQILVERSDQSFFHLGPERDKAIFDGLGMKPVELEEADFVLCSGLYDDLTETPADYSGLFSDLRQRDLPMLCANPDLKVERDNRLIYCAGALAQNYADLGQKVIYTGKPNPPIYQLSYERLSVLLKKPVDKSRILAIGDGLPTDILGAAREGLDCLFITGGIHDDQIAGDDFAAEASQLLSDHQTHARYAMTTLRW